MGVIHKLNEDVVSFIINEKKKNPAISVRKLSAVTSEQFQIKVSKSSVNTVLKNAALSSSVGRRILGKAKKERFTLPSFRKEEISGNMQKAGFIKDEASSEAKEDIQPKQAVEKEQPLPLMPDPIAQMPQQSEKEREKTVSDNVHGDQDFTAYVKKVRDLKKEKQNKMYDGMGYIFLKAAQWEISSESTMASLFKKHFAKKTMPQAFDAACEMYLFLKCLNVKTFKEAQAYQNHGLWQLNKPQGDSADEKNMELKLKELFEWELSADKQLQSNMAIEYYLEQQQLFSMVSRFKLFLNDGTQLNLSADLSAYNTEALSPTTSHSTLPIHKAMTWLSNYLISNNSDLVFHCVEGDTQFNQGFFDMVAVFESCAGKQIDKIWVLDKSGEELAEFTTIPNQKRTFIIGVTPRQKEFGQLTGNVKWAGKKPYYHQETDQIVYYTETSSSYFEGKFEEKIDESRIITVWRENRQEPFWVLLTNKGKARGEEVLRHYMTRWPHFASDIKLPDLSRDENILKTSSEKSKMIEFEGIFFDFIERLSRYCQRRFFGPELSKNDVNYLTETVYNSSGTIHCTNSTLHVVLSVPGASAQRNELARAINQINQCHVHDNEHRRLWLDLGPI